MQSDFFFLVPYSRYLRMSEKARKNGRNGRIF